jgi:hypothetical protein
LKASIDLGSRTHDLVLDDAGTVAYVATDAGLSVVDITNPEAPVEVSKVKLGGRGMGIARKDNLVFVASQAAGLNVVDVANANAVTKRSIPYKAWDVAVKDDVVYVVSYAGEVYLFRISRSGPPDDDVVLTPIKTIGLPTWNHPAHDARQLARLNADVKSGNAKVTGASITGDIFLVNDWTYGRLFYYDVSAAAEPVFKGTYSAPFLLRLEVNPVQQVAYGFAAGAGTSGIYNVPLNRLDPSLSIRHSACAECGYFRFLPSDYGGFGISSSGRYLVHLGGKVGTIEVVDISDPLHMTPAGSLPLTGHGIGTAETMGAATSGDYIFAAAGALGFRVYSYTGLSDPPD